jgi:nicotinamidase-related amidase
MDHEYQKNDTAVLITDPQNDFLSEKGVTWKLVGDSVKENKTVENIERLFKAAKKNGFEVFISPHYTTPPITRGSSKGPSKRLCTRSRCSIAGAR